MDEVVSLLPLRICHGGLIETERSITWFASLLEGDESNFLLSYHGYNLKRRRWHQNFCLAPVGEVWWQWWWIVLPCDCRHSLVSPRCSPSLNHGVFACGFSYLVDMRGARFINWNFGAPKIDLWTPYCCYKVICSYLYHSVILKVISQSTSQHSNFAFYVH